MEQQEEEAPSPEGNDYDGEQRTPAEYDQEEEEVEEGEEDGQQFSQQQMDAAQVAVNSKFGIDEEEELKKKIVLYYHTLVSNRLSLRSQLSMRFCACVVLRNPLAVVRADAAAKLQETEQGPVH